MSRARRGRGESPPLSARRMRRLRIAHTPSAARELRWLRITHACVRRARAGRACRERGADPGAEGDRAGRGRFPSRPVQHRRADPLGRRGQLQSCRAGVHDESTLPTETVASPRNAAYARVPACCSNQQGGGRTAGSRCRTNTRPPWARQQPCGRSLEWCSKETLRGGRGQNWRTNTRNTLS